MKKVLFIMVLFLGLGNINAQTNNSEEGEYLCIYAYNKSGIAISNVFYSPEFVNGDGYLDVITAGNYLRNELDFDLETYSDVIIYNHKDKSYVYDDRMEAISKAKSRGESILKFNVKCKKAKIYPIY